MRSNNRVYISLMHTDRRMQGANLFNDGDYVSAIKLFSQALAVDSSLFVVYFIYCCIMAIWDCQNRGKNGVSGHIRKRFYAHKIEALF
jgi:hypothetical protein